MAAVVVPATSKARTLQDLQALDVATPGNLNWGSFGVGSTPHLVLAEFNRTFKTTITHVPYQGSALLMQALLAGEVHATALGYSAAGEHIQAGKVRAIAVLGSTRSNYFPGMPTMAEQQMGFQGQPWIGLMAPTGTPAPILDRLNALIRKNLGDDALKKVMRDSGMEEAGGPRDAFANFLTSDQATWRDLISRSQIRLEN